MRAKISLFPYRAYFPSSVLHVFAVIVSDFRLRLIWCLRSPVPRLLFRLHANTSICIGTCTGPNTSKTWPTVSSKLTFPIGRSLAFIWETIWTGYDSFGRHAGLRCCIWCAWCHRMLSTVCAQPDSNGQNVHGCLVVSDAAARLGVMTGLSCELRYGTFAFLTNFFWAVGRGSICMFPVVFCTVY